MSAQKRPVDEAIESITAQIKANADTRPATATVSVAHLQALLDEIKSQREKYKKLASAGLDLVLGSLLMPPPSVDDLLYSLLGLGPRPQPSGRDPYQQMAEDMLKRDAARDRAASTEGPAIWSLHNIQTMSHIFAIAEPLDDTHATRESCAKLVALGLVVKNPARPSGYSPTDKGAAFIRKLKRVPLPEAIVAGWK